MNHDTNDTMTSGGEAFEAKAARFVALELDDASRANFERSITSADRELLADLERIDAGLRAMAAADEPTTAEYGRTRERALQLARTHAVPAIRRAAASRPTRTTHLPRWALAAAAAVLAIVGFVSWVGNAGPVSLPSVNSGNQLAVLNEESSGRRQELRQMWESDAETYQGLVSAFTEVDPSTVDDAADASGLDAQSDIDSQTNALETLRQMSLE